MKAALLALAAIPAAALAQTLPQPVTVGPAVIAPIDVRPRLVAPPPCLSTGIIGEEGTTGIIGEKGTAGVIGEEGSVAIVGEKGSTGIIGEEGSVGVIGEEGSQEIVGEKGSGKIIGEEGVIGARWSATGFTTFKRVLVGRPGKHALGLYGCSSAGGGETVAVYLAGADGERKTGWRHFVIATRNGNNKVGTITLPKAAPGQTLSRLPIVIVVENASGKPHAGELRLKLLD